MNSILERVGRGQTDSGTQPFTPLWGSESTAATQIRGQVHRPSPAAETLDRAGATVSKSPATLEHSLFNASARIKILTAQVSMHLPPEWRARIFLHLDRIHDAEEWEEGDSPIKSGSFQSFLRYILLVRDMRRTGMGVSAEGNLLVSWRNGENVVTAEFLPDDFVHWTAVVRRDDGLDSAAGRTTIRHLHDSLKPFSSEY